MYMPIFFKITNNSELLSISLSDPLVDVTTSLIAYLFLNTSLAMSISFILPISGTLVILDVLVILVTALIGLLEIGPFLDSLILSNICLFCSVRPD
jgi:hypothetical protein